MSNKTREQEPPAATNTRSKGPRPLGQGGLSLTVRVLASMALVWHLLVIGVSPLANSAKTSPTVRAVAGSPYMRWYSDPLYLNLGYGFFGPDPPPGWLVEYTVYDPQGQEKASGFFPDPERIWPRLRYHRYKMLADQLISPEGEPRVRYMLERYARHLIREHDGESVTVKQVLHEPVPRLEWLGDVEQGREGKSLDDQSTYRTLLSVRQTRRDVEQADQEQLPQMATAAPPVEAIGQGRAP